MFFFCPKKFCFEQIYLYVNKLFMYNILKNILLIYKNVFFTFYIRTQQMQQLQFTITIKAF